MGWLYLEPWLRANGPYCVLPSSALPKYAHRWAVREIYVISCSHIMAQTAGPRSGITKVSYPTQQSKIHSGTYLIWGTKPLEFDKRPYPVPLPFLHLRQASPLFLWEYLRKNSIEKSRCWRYTAIMFPPKNNDSIKPQRFILQTFPIHFCLCWAAECRRHHSKT